MRRISGPGGRIALATLFCAAIVAAAVSIPEIRALRAIPILSGCPAASERVGLVDPSFSHIVDAARRVVYRQIVHRQGKAERRTAGNTPVVAVVMELGQLQAKRVPWQGQLLANAARLCGRKTARSSSAVVFDDGLTTACCRPPITVYVVRTDRSWRVYPAPP
jgi:hypothetical protein